MILSKIIQNFQKSIKIMKKIKKCNPLFNRLIYIIVLFIIIFLLYINLNTNINNFDLKVTLNSLDSYIFHKNETIFFLKTHKTASSTVNGILYRLYCDEHSSIHPKKCFKPPKNNPGKTWNLLKSKDMNYITNQLPINVWIHHIRYNKQKILTILPEMNHIITIIRHPSERFQSSYHWYSLHNYTKLTLQKFIYILNNDYTYGIYTYYLSYLLPYRTGLDITTQEILGISKFQWNYYQKKFNELLKDIINGKYILLITNRFDESMLLLYYILKLNNFNNLLYLKQKVKNNIIKINELLTENEMKLLEIYQPNDMILYNIANEILNQLINIIGNNNFNNNLIIYKNGLKRYTLLCESIHIYNNTELFQFHKWNDSIIFQLQNHCNYLQKDNYDYIQDYWNTSNKTERQQVILPIEISNWLFEV